MNGNPRHSIMARRTGGQAGTAALELVIVAPAVLALFLLILALIRTSTAAGAVASAARDAARQASIARTPAAARASACRGQRPCGPRSSPRWTPTGRGNEEWKPP